ncbi:MAG: diadenylate cyclase CdaA [Clostridia bacterium]|nr:diadenylate cyclase CdaA [Clostridia bacterium]MBQ2274147.1 diadenylate cyclase CdaA [Clostridia bacterium]MBQ5798884.1 diadenylate cyclase CdaA [Clostridia bacterium]
MGSFFSSLANVFEQVFFALKNIRLFDVLDILVVAFIIYKCVDFFKKSRAGQLMKGVFMLLLIFLVAQWLDLVSLKWLLNKLIDSAIVVAAIIFQPELRRVLERVGRGQLGGNRTITDESEVLSRAIDAVCKSCAAMQEQKIGALIVFERSTLLSEIADTGTLMDAEASTQLISNIFFPKSPLHDGALLLREGRLLSAGCILPLTSNENIHSSLGTRHRAAIGLSENTDAAVVVVSEETGIISVAVNGEIKRNFNTVTLRGELNELLFIDENSTKSEDLFSKIKNIFKRK